MAENYTYDPSELISKSFKEVAGDVSNIYKMVVDRKKRDYDIAENIYTNIEALKEKVNMYGRQDITNKANELLGQLSGSIKETGMLDQSKAALVTQKVRQLRQEKQAWEDKADLRKEYQTKILSQKDMIPNIEKALADGDKITMDKNILDPQDATKHFDRAFKNNLDEMAVLQRAYQTIRPKSSINGMKTNGDKSVTSYSGEGYFGDSYDPVTKSRVRPATTGVFDPNTKTTIQIPTEEADYQAMEKSHPEVIDLFVEKQGAAANLLPASERRKIIFNDAVNRLPIDIKETYKAPPKPTKVKEPSQTDIEAGSFGKSLKPYSVSLPGGIMGNAIPSGRKVLAQISPNEKGVVSAMAKGSDGSLYGKVSFKKGTDIAWGDEDQDPQDGVDTKWVKITTPPKEFMTDFEATSRLSFKGKLGGVFANAVKNLSAPKGGSAPASTGGGKTMAPPTNPAAVAFTNKDGIKMTEGMIYAKLKAGKFVETREQYIARNKK